MRGLKHARSGASEITEILELAHYVIGLLFDGTAADQARAWEHIASCEGLAAVEQLELDEAVLAESDAVLDLIRARTAFLQDRTPDAARRYLRAIGHLLLHLSPPAAALRSFLTEARHAQ